MTDNIVKAGWAKSILDDPLFKEAVDSIRQELLEAIEATQLSQREQREQAYFALRALQSVMGKLREHVDQAKLDQRRSNTVG